MASDFPTHRRRGSPEVPADLPEGRATGHAARDHLPLRQGQSLGRALPGHRGNAARPGYDVAHHLGNAAQRPADGVQRFPFAPAAPHFRLLRRRQTRATSLHHEASILGSCCIDRLNSPRIEVPKLGLHENLSSSPLDCLAGRQLRSPLDSPTALRSEGDAMTTPKNVSRRYNRREALGLIGTGRRC